jgi:hypothetical protein
MVRTIVVLLGAALLLAGCTSTAGSAMPTATPRSSQIAIHSSSTVHRELTPPPGARSARIRLSCTGSRISLTFGGDLQDRGTTCDAPRTFTMPVSGDLDLDLEPGPGTSFTTTVTFSHAAFRADPVLAKQCALASTAESDIVSAGNGLATGRLSTEAAQALLQQARATIEGGPFDGEAGGELSTLRTWIDANPGADPRQAPLGSHLGRLCADNATPVVVMSAYGG